MSSRKRFKQSKKTKPTRTCPACSKTVSRLETHLLNSQYCASAVRTNPTTSSSSSSASFSLNQNSTISLSNNASLFSRKSSIKQRHFHKDTHQTNIFESSNNDSLYSRSNHLNQNKLHNTNPLHHSIGNKDIEECDNIGDVSDGPNMVLYDPSEPHSSPFAENDNHDYVIAEDINNFAFVDAQEHVPQGSDVQYIDLEGTSKQMFLSSQHNCFNKQILCSLKLFQILHRADAPIGLYNELVTYITHIVPILSETSNPKTLEKRDSLLKIIHSMIFNGGNPKSSKNRRKPKTNTSEHYDVSCTTDISSNNPTVTSQSTDHSKENYRQPCTEKNNPTHPFSLLPFESSVMLSNSNGVYAKVTRFDFVSNVVSLLQDPSLMDFNNTLYHRKQYLDPTNNFSSHYEDIHTSKWFLDSFEKYKIPTNQHVCHFDSTHHGCNYKNILLCPLIFFIDGVAIDSMGRKSLEPVSFTLGIFNQSTRNKFSSWRVLGYVPNVEKSTTLKYSKLKDGTKKWKKHHYHQMLQSILSQVQNIQQRGGIVYNLPYPDKGLIPTLLKFPIMFIIGDCLGNDKLCNRKQNYKPTKSLQTGVCRDCNVTYKFCDKGNFKCNMIYRKFLKKSLQETVTGMGFCGDIDLLNAFDSLDFGGDEAGINGSTPPESLHQWFLGIVKFVLEYFLDHVTTKCKKVLDQIVQKISFHFYRQSDRNIPNIRLFKNGLEKAKLTGSEYGDLLFMVYLAMLPLESKAALIEADNSANVPYRIQKQTRLDGKVSNVRIQQQKILHTSVLYNKWISLFEKMISIGEWLKSPSVDKSSLEHTESVDLYTLDGFEEFHSKVCSGTSQIATDIYSGSDSIEDAHIPEIDESMEHLNHVHFSAAYDELGIKDTDLISPDPLLLDPSGEESVLKTQDNVDNINIQHEVDEFTTEYKNHNNIKKCSFEVSKVEIGLRNFMKELHDILNQEDRLRLKTVKFHHILHYPYYIHKYGSPTNFDGAVPECIGKETAKHVGKHTQQREETINFQSALRFAENTIIRMGFELANHNNQYSSNNGFGTYFQSESFMSRLSMDTTKNLEEDDTAISCRDDIVNNGDESTTGDGDIQSSNDATTSISKVVATSRRQFKIVISPRMNANRPVSSTRNRQIEHIEVSEGKNTPLPKDKQQKDQVFKLLKDIIKYFWDRKVIDKHRDLKFTLGCYSNVKLSKDGITIRSMYDFYGDMGWYDWVNIDWGDNEGVLPAKVLMILDVSSLKIELSKKRDCRNVDECNSPDEAMFHELDDIMLVIQSVQGGHVNPHNKFTSKLGKLHKMDNEIYLLSLDSVHSTCFVIPDIKYHSLDDEGEDIIQKNILYHQLGKSSGNVISVSDRSLFRELFFDVT